MASLDEILFTEANHLKKNAFLSRKLDAKKSSTTQKEADPVFQLRSKQTRDLAFNASLQRKLRACEAVRCTEVCKSPPRATVSVGGKPSITDADAVLIKSNLLCQDSPVKLSSTVQPEPPALPRRRVMENCLIKSSEQLAGLKKLPATGSELCEQFEGMNIRCKAADMVVVMQEHALRFAHQAVFSSQKLQFKMIAHLLKKEFDQTYGPAWHCIAGSSFGSYVTHSVGGFFYFSVGKVSILLFKTTVEVVDHK